jgi:HD superfamily phosphohydrolase
MDAEVHQARDPLHVFIEFDAAERAVIDSAPYQRLRHINQLALSYLVYPGATHKRFEHCLGVMELAGRIFDTVTRPENLSDSVRSVLPRPTETAYWRSVLRVAALCHDMGHLPFSHAGEGLLPRGWSHERLSRTLIESPEMSAVWNSMRPKPEPEDVVKLALGQEEAPDLVLDPWEALLSEMVVGDVFGADRIDYLLRDSLHTGVAYGRFDHHRLIQSIRILREPAAEEAEPVEERKPALGIRRGGLESAEALLLARYQMFSQVYFHHTRLIYDIHLADFLRLWLQPDGGKFSVDPEKHLRMTDVEVLRALSAAARNKSNRAHEPARRIVERDHFRRVYQRESADVDQFPEATRAIYEALKSEIGAHNVRYADARKSTGSVDFPVHIGPNADDTAPSQNESDVLSHLPAPKGEYIYVARERRQDAKRFIRDNKTDIITAAMRAEQE